MTITSSRYADWIEGNATPYEAANELAGQLKTIQEQKALIEQREQEVRGYLSEVVAAHGEPISAAGLKFELTAPGVTVTYPKADVEQFILKLLQDGYGPLAMQLQDLAKRSDRASGLRVTKEKIK